jgi:hypothetical protein
MLVNRLRGERDAGSRQTPDDLAWLRNRLRGKQPSKSEEKLSPTNVFRVFSHVF